MALTINYPDNGSGVYAFLNRTTGKFYVGSTGDLLKRLREHLNALHRGDHHSRKLQSSWNKHGAGTWAWMVLEDCRNDKETLLVREAFWMERLDSVNSGYNVCIVPGSCKGIRLSDEHRRKIGNSNRNQRRDPHSEEHKKAISAKLKGRKLSVEHRASLSRAAALRDISHLHTPEIIQKSADGHRGLRRTEETKTKMRNAAQKRVQAYGR